jgi:pimeloyl-ACP methyl ester carboxylesterase
LEDRVIERRHIVIPSVAPSGRSPTWYTAAWLTVPEELQSAQLQILVHGANSDHRYWDFPIEPETYSYVAWAEERGVATLAIDRIGSGASSRPAGSEITIEAQAETLHQVIQAVRRGLDGAPPFAEIVLVGASLGSVVSGVEAATYCDIDAAILTAYLPVDSGAVLDEDTLSALFEPATRQVPRLIGLVDDGYVVPRGDVGSSWLYWSATADEAIVAAAGQMADVTTRAELAGAANAGAIVRTSQVPTLFLVGQFDPLLFDPSTDIDCNDSSSRVAAISLENFEYRVAPETGHPLNLHRTAHQSFRVMNEWLEDLARPVR